MSDFSSYPNFNKYRGINILAIDYGTNVIGLAFYCPNREPFPIPRGRIINKCFSQVCDELNQVFEDEFIELVVMGMPYFTDGTESEKTKEIRKVFNQLIDRFPQIEFIEQDESLTTTAAKERMLNSAQYNFSVDLKKIDEVAATIILEDFIRS